MGWSVPFPGSAGRGTVERSEGKEDVVGAVRSAAVTVLTVDDQEIFRRAARELIAAAEGFVQIAEATSGAEALRMARAMDPDLILLDVRMPGMDGLETARRLHDDVPTATVVLMSLDELPSQDGPQENEHPPAHVRKQDLSVTTLRDLWRRHGHATV
jgi:two-component system invasion response regulator UvrY